MRYKRLAEQIIQDCLNNIYAPGSKMPSLRKMAHIQNVSLTTAQNCYHYLEELGWIVSKPQSGFYVSRPFGTHDAPKPLHFTSQITSLNTQDFSGNVLSEVFPHSVLGISQISPDLMPTLPLQRCFKRAISESSRHLHQYPNIQGIEALRNALSHHFSAYGLPLPSDDWVITNGCINAVYLAVEATTQEGDAIAITSPCFGGLLEMLAMMKRNVVELPCNNTGIDLQEVSR